METGLTSSVRSLAEKHGQLSDRGAMGLPDTYTTPTGHDLGKSLQALRGASSAELVDVAEGADEPLERRLSAGLLLGGLGDPRIRVLDPPMIRIPGETVEIGLDPAQLDEVTAEYADVGVDRSWIEKECPRHRVKLSSYAIGRFPVTNSEYAVFLEETGHPELPTSWPMGRFGPFAGNRPVTRVTHEAADAYAAWLSRRTGRRFRLPSEAEWEYAAAGPDALVFPWGDRFEADRTNTVESGLLMATPIGCFPRGDSPFGVSDLAGNVEECVADVYAAYPGGVFVADDLVEKLGTYRVTRGGSYTRFRDLARCQRRHGPYPGALYPIGFRLAEDIQDPPSTR